MAEVTKCILYISELPFNALDLKFTLEILLKSIGLYQVPCPKFGILGLCNQHRVFNCCRHAKKNKITICKLEQFTIVATQFFPCKD